MPKHPEDFRVKGEAGQSAGAQGRLSAIAQRMGI